MKLNRFNVKQNKIYSSKFEWEIQMYADFMNDFTVFQYAYRLRHGIPQVGKAAPAKDAASCFG